MVASVCSQISKLAFFYIKCSYRWPAADLERSLEDVFPSSAWRRSTLFSWTLWRSSAKRFAKSWSPSTTLGSPSLDQSVSFRRPCFRPCFRASVFDDCARAGIHCVTGLQVQGEGGAAQTPLRRPPLRSFDVAPTPKRRRERDLPSEAESSWRRQSPHPLCC